MEMTVDSTQADFLAVMAETVVVAVVDTDFVEDSEDTEVAVDTDSAENTGVVADIDSA